MPSTLARLRYIDQVNREGRLASILFDRVNGPQALIAALPDMIRLIEAAERALDQGAGGELAAATAELTRDRP